MILTALILLGIMCLPALILYFSYNSLINAKHEVENAAQQVGVQFERREELIPKLVDAMKTSMIYEKGMWDELGKIMAAQNNSHDTIGLITTGDPTGMDIMKVIGKMTQLPEIKANVHISMLMEEITSTENKLAYSKRYFYESVANLKKTAEKFPNILLASAARIPAEYLQTSLPAPPKPFEIGKARLEALSGKTGFANLQLDTPAEPKVLSGKTGQKLLKEKKE